MCFGYLTYYTEQYKLDNNVPSMIPTCTYFNFKTLIYEYMILINDKQQINGDVLVIKC